MFYWVMIASCVWTYDKWALLDLREQIVSLKFFRGISSDPEMNQCEGDY